MQPRAIVGMSVGRGKGGYKPMAPGFTPFLQKRSFGMLGSDTSSHVKRFEDDTKRLKQEPRCGVEVPVPNVCVNNKQDEMSGEDCDNDVGIGINPHDDDDDDDHQQQQQQHERKDDKEEDDDDDDDSDSDSSSDDSSSGSDSDSRTRSIDAGKDCAAAPTARPCNDQKADQLQPVKKEQPIIKEEQPVKKEQHCDCDDIAESREMKSEPLKDQMGTTTVREHIHHLELEAYAALMKAFHACGNALSWEKEGLLSDLRVHLHISNDEHLQVLNVILNRKRRTGGPR
jgi:hypothetical protein